MKVYVVGAGAMGCALGARLATAGAAVMLHDVNVAHVDAINRAGVTVEGVFGETNVRIPATTEVPAGAQADVALILVDSSATDAAATVASRVVKADGVVLTLQNGIGNVERIVARCGEARVLMGSTYNSAAYLQPGRVIHSHLGQTVLGEIGGPVSGRARDLAAWFSDAGLPTEATDNALGHVWSKFVLNCAINPVCAMTGFVPGELARDPSATRLLERVLDEILQVVERKGIRLPDVDTRRMVLDHCRERFNRPSMLQHVDRGSRTEIDALNGALVREARALDVPVPANEIVVLAIEAIQARAGAGRLARQADRASS